MTGVAGVLIPFQRVIDSRIRLYFACCFVPGFSIVLLNKLWSRLHPFSSYFHFSFSDHRPVMIQVAVGCYVGLRGSCNAQCD